MWEKTTARKSQPHRRGAKRYELAAKQYIAVCTPTAFIYRMAGSSRPRSPKFTTYEYGLRWSTMGFHVNRRRAQGGVRGFGTLPVARNGYAPRNFIRTANVRISNLTGMPLRSPRTLSIW